MAESASPAAVRKAVARVALVGLEPGVVGILRDCFRQFSIEICEVPRSEVARFSREKFEGCVVDLDEDAETVLHTARNSPSNRRLVVYGICGSAQQAMRYSRFGVNSLIRKPVERQEALKVVRSTHLLVVHELRCYVRVPLATEVRVEIGADRIVGTTQEVSGGGMSIRGHSLPRLGSAARVRFDLPTGARISRIEIEGRVCWVRDRDSMFGVRFEATDPGRLHVRKWIDEYLEID